MSNWVVLASPYEGVEYDKLEDSLAPFPKSAPVLFCVSQK